MTLAALHELAHRYGVETSYWEMQGRHHQATPEALVAVLKALGAAVERPEDAPDALRLRHAEIWRTAVEPCVAATTGEPVTLTVRLPEWASGPLAVTYDLESGGEWRTERPVEELPVVGSADVDGQRFVERRVELTAEVPLGYHRLRVEGAGVSATATVLCAPRRAYGGPGELRSWGVFAPTYAIRASGDLGVGDLGGLRAVARWTHERSGTLVGTLPLLACFYREAENVSPYAPVTRLFWNELYADLRPMAYGRLGLPGAAALVDPDLAAEAAALEPARLVDYRAAAALKRRVLDQLAAAVWQNAEARARLEAFAEERAALEDYARFRALGETLDRPWGAWPAAQQGGVIRPGEYDEAARRAHLLGQFIMTEQLAELKADDASAGLYLDLPVGVNGDGYDLWRERDSFAPGISVGAPPDPLCAGGQNWALPPLHPLRQRQNGYRYFAASVRAHMEHAAMLRIDHVMGLHRLFWIPAGGSAAEGVYVRYPAEELYAVVNIESHRQRCAVAGEDLGTVPDYVRPTMADRGLHSLFVAEFGWSRHDGVPEVHQPPAGSVATLDTHDTMTFATFAEREGMGDDAAIAAVMDRWLDRLAASPADVVLVTLEDLWLEREPQNVPGTTNDEQPNWRRRMVRTLDEIRADPAIRATLDRIVALRGVIS